jgi:hypothetical protein
MWRKGIISLLNLRKGEGRAIAQVVSRRPLTLEAGVCAHVSPCGVGSGQSGTGTRFSPSSSVFLSKYHSTMSLHTRISSEG